MLRSLIITVAIAATFVSTALAQEKGRFSGGFEANTNFFIRDSLIGAANIPQYDRQLTGGEGWLNLNYAYDEFDIRSRFDFFHHSNLRNPTASYTGQGLGMWSVAKSIKKLDLIVGHIYDQIGSGVIFRSYESRPLLIDNALYGAMATYNLNDNWKVKGFTGKQRFLFDIHPGIVKGGNLEGFVQLGNEEKGFLNLSPGFGIVNRTMEDETIDEVVNIIRFYKPEDIVTPKHNTYAFTAYNTLSYKWLTWYVEGAYKTKEVFYDQFETRETVAGSTVTGRMVNRAGSVLYTSVGIAKGKLGLTLEAKRTENFNFRVDPNLRLINGIINYLPPMNRQNSYRLTARYSPATQDLSEQAFQVDARYRINKKWSVHANFSDISTLDGEQLYQEVYLDALYKYKRKWQLAFGVQRQVYNQEVYEVKPEVPNVETITPFADFLYRFTRKKSIRLEAQYMDTEQDYGKWLFGLVEVGLAPHWIFEGSLMYNMDPNEERFDAVRNEEGEVPALVYPTLGAVYVNGANRYSLRYVKQVQGIVCTGGICRLEPAFSGLKLQMTSTF